MRAPAPYRAEQDYLDAEDSKDQTMTADNEQAAQNGSSTPPAPEGPKPYQPPAQESVSAARPVTQAPTFSQMQAAGEARPPMPEPETAQSASAAPLSGTMPGIQSAPATPPPPPAPTLSGLTPSGKDPRTEWVQQQQAMYKPDYSGAAPVGGVPAPTAGPTPQVGAPSTGGAFPGADGKGAVSGGTDGTGWATFDQSQAAPMSEADMTLYKRIGSGDQALMNQYKQQYGGDWLSKWNADQDRLTTAFNNQTNAAGIANLSGKSGAEAWSVIGSNLQNLNAIRAMTPKQRTQFLDQWPAGSYDRQLIEGSMAAQGITVDSGDTGQRWDGTTQNNGPMASAVPVYQQTQAGTVNSQGLPGYGSSGPAPQVGPPITYMPAETGVPRPGGVQTTTVPTGGGGGAPAVGTTSTATVPPSPSAPVNGAGVPGGSNPSSLDILGQLMGGATAPGKYGTEQVKNAYDWMGGQIDDQYKLAEKDLQEEMARRGLSTSTIGAGRLSDLNVGRRSAKESLAYDLGDKIASTGAADQSSRLDWLRNLIGYGQQGFENDLATANFNDKQNNNWQDFLLKMLGAGYGTAGA